jgi:hypothetical protein
MSEEDEEEEEQEKKLVGVRIEEDRRQRWKKEIEESDEFNSMAQAMRVGFERLFDEEAGAGGMETEKIIERMDKLEEEIEENREQIERIPFQYPSVEELAEEVVYRLGKEGRAKKEDKGERY